MKHHLNQTPASSMFCCFKFNSVECTVHLVFIKSEVLKTLHYNLYRINRVVHMYFSVYGFQELDGQSGTQMREKPLNSIDINTTSSVMSMLN